MQSRLTHVFVPQRLEGSLSESVLKKNVWQVMQGVRCNVKFTRCITVVTEIIDHPKAFEFQRVAEKAVAIAMERL